MNVIRISFSRWVNECQIDHMMDYRLMTSPMIQVVGRCVEWYQPGAIVLQCGADSLAGDKIGCFNMSMQGRLCRLSSSSAGRLKLAWSVRSRELRRIRQEIQSPVVDAWRWWIHHQGCLSGMGL